MRSLSIRTHRSPFRAGGARRPCRWGRRKLKYNQNVGNARWDNFKETIRPRKPNRRNALQANGQRDIDPAACIWLASTNEGTLVPGTTDLQELQLVAEKGRAKERDERKEVHTFPISTYLHPPPPQPKPALNPRRRVSVGVPSLLRTAGARGCSSVLWLCSSRRVDVLLVRLTRHHRHRSQLSRASHLSLILGRVYNSRVNMYFLDSSLHLLPTLYSNLLPSALWGAHSGEGE